MHPKNAKFLQSVDEIVELCATNLDFMGLEKHNLMQIRKEAIVFVINQDYKSLSKSSGDNSDSLFGDGLSKQIQYIDTSNRLSEKLSVPSTSATYNSSKTFRNRHFLGQRRGFRNDKKGIPTQSRSRPYDRRQGFQRQQTKNYPATQDRLVD